MDKVSGKTTNITQHGQNTTQSIVDASNTKNDNNMSFKNNSQAKSSIGRLNALDSTLMENNAYKEIDNNDFKIEYEIEKLETELKTINEELSVIKNFNNENKIEILKIRKNTIEKNLEELYQSYKNIGLSGKLTNTLIKPKKNIFGNVFNYIANFISENILSKISPRFYSGQNLKTAVNQLVNINKNVDELITHQAPYGESEEKYDQLTMYITKANSIQYKVSKELSGKKSKIKINPFAELTSKNKADKKSKKSLQLNKKKDMAQKNALNLNNNLK